jgi:hypothetical protein
MVPGPAPWPVVGATLLFPYKHLYNNLLSTIVLGGIIEHLLCTVTVHPHSISLTLQQPRCPARDGVRPRVTGALCHPAQGHTTDKGWGQIQVPHCRALRGPPISACRNPLGVRLAYCLLGSKPKNLHPRPPPQVASRQTFFQATVFFLGLGFELRALHSQTRRSIT